MMGKSYMEKDEEMSQRQYSIPTNIQTRTVYRRKRTVGEWWWSNLYNSYHMRVMREDRDYYKFFYLMINLSLEKFSFKSSFQQINLDENMFKIIWQSPIRDEFFDGQEIKREYIYFPLESFQIMSNPINRKGIKINVYPIIDKEGDIIGIDFWTSQWFWGLFDDKSSSNRDVFDVFQKKVERLSTFSNLDRIIRELRQRQVNDDMEMKRKSTTPVYINQQEMHHSTSESKTPVSGETMMELSLARQSTRRNSPVNQGRESGWSKPSVSNFVDNFSSMARHMTKK